jgi:hypothetical protein
MAGTSVMRRRAWKRDKGDYAFEPIERAADSMAENQAAGLALELLCTLEDVENPMDTILRLDRKALEKAGEAGFKAQRKGANDAEDGVIDDVLEWLTHTPDGDANWVAALKRANKATLAAALEDQTLKKGARAKIQARLNKLAHKPVAARPKTRQ